MSNRTAKDALDYFAGKPSATKYANEERLQMLGELKGDKCYCGKKKTSMRAFCRGHFLSLPPKMQSALYKRFGDGYEEAYTAARQWLKERAHPAVTRVD